MKKINLFWFRRDLRLTDNAGLFHALKEGLPVLPIFIFDAEILDDLVDKRDARVEFIRNVLQEIHQELLALGSTLDVRFGKPAEVWEKLTTEYDIAQVFTNHDYEPYAIQRDEAIAQHLNSQGIAFKTFKDHVIFEKLEIVKKDGTPYTVFTPYSRKWKEKLLSDLGNVAEHHCSNSTYLQAFPSEKYLENFLKTTAKKIPTLEDIGFKPSAIAFPPKVVAQKTIKDYGENRDFPARNGTSKLGVHFRFGTISIREKARKASLLNDTYLNELIWRDFYAMILANFPHVVGNAFRAKYEAVPWREAEEDFECWCQGKTGYPLVDAGMRELLTTGYMHNRVRMVVASFLTKHLLIDWRRGEAWFAQKLLDFDLASNNGGWQWAAGCGTDAAPYFRIFNPSSQLKKFDKDLSYVKKWVPEYGTTAYPPPMVEHKFARERCLQVYKMALNS